jgi:O-antigen ligase
MTRTLLALLFIVLLAADALELNLSLAPGLSVKNAFLYLIVFVIAVETALTRNRRFECMSVIVPYSLYFFYACFTLVIVVVFVNYPGYEILQAIISLKSGVADNLLVFLVFFYGVLTAKDAESLIKVMIWTVVVANVITVIDGFNIPDLGIVSERDDGRIGGPIGESNQFAAFLALFLPGILALALLERGAVRVIAFIGFGFSLIAFLMAASRGGFLGVVGGTMIGFVLLRRYISPKLAISAAGSIVGLAIVAVVILSFTSFGDLLYERFLEDSTKGSATHISSGRTYIWTTALNKMFENPITLVTGYGWDTYFQFRIFRYAPHNSYLNIFFELGAIGILPVLITFTNVVRHANRAMSITTPETRAVLFAFVIGLLAILVAIFFVDISSPWIFLWAYIGASMRLAIEQEKVASSKIDEVRDTGLSHVKYGRDLT